MKLDNADDCLSVMSITTSGSPEENDTGRVVGAYCRVGNNGRHEGFQCLAELIDKAESHTLSIHRGPVQVTAVANGGKVMGLPDLVCSGFCLQKVGHGWQTACSPRKCAGVCLM